MKQEASHTQFSPADAKLALHACCGPCAIEVVLAFELEGFEPTIFWSNDNLWPGGENQKRLETLRTWAEARGLPVHVCKQTDAWENDVAPLARDVLQHKRSREERCRSCYRTRLEQSAREARDLGFTHLATTLAVSPYQLLDACNDELAKVAKKYGLTSVARDFRHLYEAGKQKSIEAGMYRQKYCGCRFSAIEAQDGRLKAREHARERKRKSQCR